jgi:hypothetical protein
VVAPLLDPGLWFVTGFLGAALGVMLLRAGPLRTERRLNLAYGIFLGTMGLGHLVAVAIKSALGTLPATTSWMVWPLGFALAVPSFWIAVNALRLPRDEAGFGRQLVALDAGLVLLLVSLGPSAVLGIPALLNLGYRFSTGTTARAAITAVSCAGYLALLAAFLVTGPGNF